MRNFLRKIELNIRLLFDRQMEKKILFKVCKGNGIDVGCGSNKICSSSIGVDLTLRGDKGKYGNQKGAISQADVQSSGDNLPFKDESFDYVVAKHNLEHYSNPEKTLLEWKRVLKKKGKIGVIVPDNNYVDSDALDITHYSKFNLSSLSSLFKKAGLHILEKGQAIHHWSVYIIAEK